MDKQRNIETLGTRLYNPPFAGPLQSPPSQGSLREIERQRDQVIEGPVVSVLEQLVVARLLEYIKVAQSGTYMTPDIPVYLSLKLPDEARVDLIVPSYEAALIKAVLEAQSQAAGVEGLVVKIPKHWLVPWIGFRIPVAKAMQYAAAMCP